MVPTDTPTPDQLCLGAAGCSTYTIEGRVVEGAVSDMTFVLGDDPRLSDPPLSGVRITVERDPGRLSRQMAGTDLSDAHGRFAIVINDFGAGWMDERWRIQASRMRYQTASRDLRLDRSNRRLLIILATGVSDAPEGEDLIKQFERYK